MKYAVINLAELARFGDEATKTYIQNLLSFLETQRREAKLSEHQRLVNEEAGTATSFNRPPKEIPLPSLQAPIYFTLKLSDPFAMAALENYIDRVVASDLYTKDNGLKAAVAAAIEAKNRALTHGVTKIPDRDPDRG